MKKPTKIYLQKLAIDANVIAKLEALQQETSTTVSLLLECVLAENSLKQASILKKVSPVISELDDTSFSTCIHILAHVFVVFDYKNPARRALSSLFDNLPGSRYDVSLDNLASVVLDKLDEVQKNIGLTEWDPRPAIDMVLSLMENFTLGSHVITRSGLHVLGCMSTYLRQMVQNARLSADPMNQTVLMNNCQAAIKSIIAVVQKVSKQLQVTPSLVCLFETIATDLVVILSNDFLPDCQTASGMALICLIICLFTNQDHYNQLILETFFPHYTSNQSTEHQVQTENQGWISRVLMEQKWQAPLSFAHLCLCHGVLTMTPLEELVKPLDYPKLGKSQTLLFDVILSDLCLLCKSLKEPFSCVTSYKVLTLWAKQVRNSLHGVVSPVLLTQVHGSAAIPQKLLSIVWNNWEHPIETVRYQVKAIFDHVVNMHVISSGQDPSNDNFLKDISGKLLQMGLHTRGIYGPLCCLTTVTGAKCLLDWHPCIPGQLMEMLKDNITAPHVIDLIEIMSTAHMHEIVSAGKDMDFWLRTWVVPVISVLSHQGSIQEGVHIEQTVSKLLRCYPESLQFIVNNLQNHYNKNIGSLITCLKTARTMGLIKVNENQSKAETWGGVVPVTWLEKALCHIEEQIRLDALGLLCDCPRTTEPISITDLVLLKMFFPLNLNNQSPSFRQQCTTYLKKLLMRMKECLRISAKQLDRFKDDELHINRLKAYKEFLQWFKDLMFSSLFPGGSFARRTTALHFLKLLNIIFVNDKKVVKCGTFVFNDIVTKANITVLVDCLHDTYDVNKVLAYELLMSCPNSCLPFQTIDALEVWLQRLDSLLSSPRAVDATTASVTLKLLIEKCSLGLYLQSSNSDCKGSIEIRGFSRIESQTYRVLCHLLDSLKTQRAVAEQSLNQAASQAPMHNTIHCLREILGHLSLSKFSTETLWKQLVSSLLNEGFRVASVVSPVVTCSSPEGHMIDDDYDELLDGAVEGIFNSSSQILLVCCWRTMKEVALLLGDLVQCAPIKTCDTEASLLTSEQVRDIGRFFTTVLLTSKHHGAFELAYNGFIKLCSVLWTCRDSSLQSLPLHWLETLLSDIRGCVPSNVLCGTRRSAGVPFFIQAIVTTEPAASSKASLKHIMNELLAIASQPINTHVSKDSTLPQVHANNILRALYRDTRLGEDVCQFVSRGIKVAINGFLSDSWAVRNSSTLLFSALMTRIFGVKKSKDEHSRRNCLTGREFFTRFPELHAFLVDKLRQCTEAIDRATAVNLHPSLYPVLVLLSRLYPSTLDGVDSTLNMSAFVPYVIRCGSSSVLKARSMAARAIVPLASGESMVQTIKELFLSLPTSSLNANQNKMHGALLQIQHIIKGHLVQSTASNLVKGMVANNVLPTLETVYWISTRCNPCDVTRAVFLDITLDLCVHNNLELKGQKGKMENFVDNITRIRGMVMETALHETISVSPKPQISIGVSLVKEVCSRIVLASVLQCRKFEEKRTCCELSLSGLDDAVNLVSKPMNHCHVVCCLLSSREYEVRLAALHHLDTNLPRNNPRLSCDQEGRSNQKKCYIDFDGEDLSKIALALLEMALGKEHHLDCLAQDGLSHIYGFYLRVLKRFLTSELSERWRDVQHEKIKFVSPSDHVYYCLSLVVNYLTFPLQSSVKLVSYIECWRYFLTKADHSSELRDGIICSLLDLLSKLANSVYEEYSSTDKAPIDLAIPKMFHDFSLLLKSTSKEDASFEVRLKTAGILSGGALDALLWDPCSLLGGFPLELWEVLVDLLHDDDSYIRDCAARVVLTNHDENRAEDVCFSTPTLAIKNVLCTICTHFLPKEPRVTLQWMLGWIVTIDTVSIKHSKANYKQSEIDLLFDRNSLNSYQERVVLARCALHCLNEALLKAGNNLTPIWPRDAVDERSTGETRRDIIYRLIDDVASGCISKLQGIIARPDVSSRHFLEIFSNLNGLVASGRLLSNLEILNTAVNGQDGETEELIVKQKKKNTEPMSKLIEGLVSNVKLMDLFCHPLMADCVRDLSEIYSFSDISLQV